MDAINHMTIKLISTSIQINDSRQNKYIVCNVNADIRSGYVFAIMGGSGSGDFSIFPLN